MNYIKRHLNIELPPKQSAFLWGARKTGKSTYLKNNFPDAYYYDLLKSDIYLKFLKAPHILREEVLAMDNKQNTIIIDEIQKVPQLLDEIHWLIENTDHNFILCGSSARKLKKHSVNMLGGRAWKYNFYPLVFSELADNNFDLLRIFNNGLIPSHYHMLNARRSLKAYVEDYISQEILAEGLVRNLPGFSRFIDILKFCDGETINYTNIARQASIDAKTVKEYFAILVDTMLGYYLLPFKEKLSRDSIFEMPKFYLFDVGLSNYLKNKQFKGLDDIDVGRSLEQLVFLEINAYKHYQDLNFEINYWRTKSGLEIDFILDRGRICIEVKKSKLVHKSEFTAIKAFNEDITPERNIRPLAKPTYNEEMKGAYGAQNPNILNTTVFNIHEDLSLGATQQLQLEVELCKRSIIVSMEDNKRLIQYDGFNIEIYPIKQFLQELWEGKII